LRAITERHADVLAILATMTFHIDKVANLITEVNHAGLHGNTKILVGGYPFNIATNLWRSVGADAYARDDQQALDIAEGLVS